MRIGPVININYRTMPWLNRRRIQALAGFIIAIVIWEIVINWPMQQTAVQLEPPAGDHMVRVLRGFNQIHSNIPLFFFSENSAPAIARNADRRQRVLRGALSGLEEFRHQSIAADVLQSANAARGSARSIRQGRGRCFSQIIIILFFNSRSFRMRKYSRIS